MSAPLRPKVSLPSAAATDALATVTGNLKRFVSLFVICALGSSMLVGLKAACDDLRLTADAYYDDQRLYDVSVLSTLGLGSADLDALRAVDGIEDVEGSWTESAQVTVDGAVERATLKALSDTGAGMNEPQLVEGRLPEGAGEAAVTASFLKAADAAVGDEVEIAGAGDAAATTATAATAAGSGVQAADAAVFQRGSYRIVGVVRDPMEVNGDSGTMTFRTGSSVSYPVFVSKRAVLDTSTYTVAYLAVTDAASLMCYSDAYRDKVDDAKAAVEKIRDERERARVDELAAQATDAIDEQADQLNAAAALGSVDAGQLAAARAQLDAARAEAGKIEPATWYIQDRSALSSYGSVDSDASSIEAIGTVFPVIFLTVAVLISLTTVTRMVEEDRGVIGLYKALGYSRAAIMRKYLVYAGSASLLGGVAGDLVGFVVLPEIIFTIFTTMYTLPDFRLGVDPLFALAGVGLFAVAIMGATWLACQQVLRERPASLMRPKAPRAGTRILLERIGPLWRRMGFLSKVAARNLFRYKKRFFMTVFGIAGCTALVICGLGIRDTVISLKPRQYGEAGVTRYDLLAASSDADFPAARRKVEDTGAVEELISLHMDTATASFDGAREDVQLVVVPDGADLSAYVRLAGEDGSALEVPAAEGNGSGSAAKARAIVTKNAQQVLGFSEGDGLELQASSMDTGTVEVAGVAVNYLGNYVYLTQSAYREAFGHDAVDNALMARLSGTDDEQIDLAAELGRDPVFQSVTSTAEQAREFSDNFKVVDVVVYVVTVMAALLAFAVVFTLSTTNISEREREIATIKVLGFRRREVRRYVNRETMVLALIGVAAGCPAGYALVRFLSLALRMPSLYFDTLVYPASYGIACALSLAFVVAVNMMTNRSLDRIDMVGALKSAE